jgi:Xaa-Pro aminopeptidase
MPYRGDRAGLRGAEAGKAEEIITYADYDLDLTIVAYPDLLEAHLRSWLEPRAKGRRLGYEEWHLPALFLSALGRSSGAAPKGISRLLLLLRAKKDAEEVGYIRSATRRLEQVYRVLGRRAREGMSELQLYALANSTAFLGQGPFSYVLGDFVSGERSEAISGLPSSRRLRRGDTLILDLQTMYNHYWSDLSRTLIIGGAPSGEQLRAYEAIVEALKEAERALRPGAKGKDVYEAVNGALTGQGFERLPHHAGHGVGLEDQEPPFLIPGEEREIPEGSVMAVEVGIYRRGLGGVRLEQLYLVEGMAAKPLSSLPLTLS